MDPDPNASIAEVLRGTASHVGDSLDAVEFVMVIEDETGVSIRDDEAWESVVFRVLVGPGAMRTTWDCETLPARSIRGIIEERVRLRDDCACGQKVV